MTQRWAARRALILALCVGSGTRLIAHSGPPFPIVSDRVAGPYQLSVWTDPDATDNESAAGQFWVMLTLADGSDVPPDTRAQIAVRPADRPGAARTADTAAVKGEVGRRFAAVLLDHEGPYNVHVTVTGSRGTADVHAGVDATYDLRPARWLLALYVMPFLAVGFLWTKLLLARRRQTEPPRRS
jgi:hypothetical protein